MPPRTLATRVRRAMALCLALLALPAAAAEAALPDLVSDPPGAPSSPEIYRDAGGARLVMRFDGFVHNRGAGALEIRAGSRLGATMTSVQQWDTGAGSPVFGPVTPQVLFETDDLHNHWHLRNVARYSLWNSALTAEVAPAQKVGFCLVDLERVEAGGPAAAVYTEDGNRFCEQGAPTAADVTMGVSGGWRDIYDSSLTFQWVDVSDVPPGRYRLRADIDPNGVIVKSDEINPPAFAATEAAVPGYVAQDVRLASARGPAAIRLGWGSHGGVGGSPQFKIVEAPRYGRLDKPVGEWFAGSVQYTPARGSTGDDTFRFVARDPSSAFPLNPPAAVATMGDGGRGSVTISGVPARLRTGASAQLRAVVRNGSPAVSWSVNGVAGGKRRVGRISPAGLYRAPKKVPGAKRVRVGARSASGGAGTAVIKIVKAPKRRPAPDVPGGVPGSRGKNPLSQLRIARHGRRLLVSLRSKKAGRVIVGAQKDDRRVGRCSARVSPNRRMTCAMKLDRSVARVAFYCRVARTSRLALPGLKVSATLYVKGHKRAVRRARVRG